ncbi:MAG: RNA methyltransferase [Fibrobacter sp.]|uniref:THUMP domain-containing class I SAM-dependent RNA methyltransferase n=1 Tax=Fibrobacter sp. TaxID=35828 RepID=UPI0025B8BDA2|nr:RNA methyltransferase [Fibrobacter sp.]MBR4785617.1 RNA methyltransferase [Fibrobacter sp.]
MDAALEKRLKRQVIGKPHRFLAVVPLGFEQTLVEELKSVGIETIADAADAAGQFRIVGDGKVEFTAKIVEAWKAVAYSRIANRVLMHIADFKAENFRDLEKKAAEIPWELYLRKTAVPLSLRHTEARSASVSTPSNSELGTGNSLSIHVTCKHSRLYHSDAIAERLYKVIEESFDSSAPAVIPAPSHPDEGQDRHLAPERHPDVGQDRLLAHQNLYVNFLDDRCTLWLDLAGEELYKRGHERHVNDAPLKETIAAAMLFEASALVAAPITLFDPMAGSGTFSLEAAYKANGLIPGACRDFALKHQPAFKEATWKHIVSAMDSLAPTGLRNDNQNKQACPLAIITSDISERAVEIIKYNVQSGPLKEKAPDSITPKLKDFFCYTAEEITGACSEGTSPAMLLNPPYGKRLDCDAPALYAQIGRKLTELVRSLDNAGKPLTVAILSPKDDSGKAAKYTCTANLLRECPALDPSKNSKAKRIVTSHGGLTLNAFIATL